MRKSYTTSYLENYKDLRSHIQMQDSQPPESTLTISNNRIEILKLLELFKNFLKNHKKCHISKKKKRFEQSYLEAKLATPGSTLTEPHYKDRYFKFWETFQTQVF